MESPLSAGEEVDGKYLILRALGSGGMGHVYEAEDRVLGRRVALKCLPLHVQGDATASERLFREGRAAALVSHPNVVRIYEVGSDGRIDYVTMELLEGEDLDARLRRERSLPIPFVEFIALQLVDALEAIHVSGIVHRDLKPRNLFLTREGGVSDVLKVLDFGVAKNMGELVRTITETGQVFGTLHYMAPEQLRGAKHADERSDLWSVGAILYELLAGRPPFVADSATDLVLRVAIDEPVPIVELRPDATPGLLEVVSLCLQKQPDRRPSSASELRRLLRDPSLATQHTIPAVPRAELDSLLPVQAHPTLAPGSQRAHRLTHRTRWGLAVVAVAALAFLAGPGQEMVHSTGQQAAKPPAPFGMAWVPGGELRVGRDADELARECERIGAKCDRERMQREVPSAERQLNTFLLDVQEVTNRALAETLNQLGSSLYVVDDEDDHYPRYVRWNKGLGHDDSYLVDLHPKYGGIVYTAQRTFAPRAGHEELPAVLMSWHGAQLHCTRQGKRLPTEDEWELAARGTDDRPFPWGSAAPACDKVRIPSEGLILMQGSCATPTGPIAVGSAAQDVTPQGIHDLGGNVAEWVDSTYVEGNRQAHPLDPTFLLPRVIRGGSWGDSLLARSSGRTRRPPDSVGANVGFRCAASAAAETEHQ